VILTRFALGQEWTFGANRSGSIHLLGGNGSEIWVFTSQAFLPFLVDQASWSASTLIRSAVECGDLESAAKYLGRDFTILGTVTEGRQLGRRLGFRPQTCKRTMNYFPPHGVYAAESLVQRT